MSLDPNAVDYASTYLEKGDNFDLLHKNVLGAATMVAAESVGNTLHFDDKPIPYVNCLLADPLQV